jgi:putative membrane protein
MGPYQWGWQGMGFGWLFPFLFLIVLVVVLVLAVRGSGFGRGQDGGGHRETAREILDRRYANGELSKEQYEEMKRTLAG